MQATRISALEMDEGAGARVRRLFPIPGLRHHDPFVLFDNFSVGPDAGFPPHPHRGFEAITYMLDGAFQHKDNLGNRSVVSSGGAQRFTAGRGLVHSEMPAAPELNRGIQLWINLAQRDKHIDPGYQQVDAADFPQQATASGTVRTIVGPGSPLSLHTPVLYLDISLIRDGRHTVDIPAGYRGLLYIISGKIAAAGESLDAGDALLLTEMPQLTLQAATDTRCVLVAGAPHNEPIRQHDSYVD
jgi:hypothetical protein